MQAYGCNEFDKFKKNKECNGRRQNLKVFGFERLLKQDVGTKKSQKSPERCQSIYWDETYWDETLKEKRRNLLGVLLT